MPLYEYQCDVCAHRFELIQKFSDAPADTCPVCGGTVHKLLSSPAIQFKGSGWYITDYARKGSSEASKADTKKESEQSESKPAGESKPAEAKSGAGASTTTSTSSD
jgi:putative FmdB family regulatory protein